MQACFVRRGTIVKVRLFAAIGDGIMMRTAALCASFWCFVINGAVTQY
jgi:hypothetical protein